jgi:hypothetical protein
MLTKRNRAALFQHASKNGLIDQIDQAYSRLENILPLLGEQSQSSGMIYRIGVLLLKPTVRIVAPSCPDYSHENGKYTFAALGSGVPLLSKLHIELFDQLAAHLPQAKFEIVIADQEATDKALCLKTGQTEAEFLARIKDSAQATRGYVDNRPYQTHLMTERFPTLRTLEKQFAATLTKDMETMRRIQSDTVARGLMYQRLGITTSEEMFDRTLKTASQYCALAHLAATEGFLVCNHETVNLGWYNREQAAVLHNAVSIY